MQDQLNFPFKILIPIGNKVYISVYTKIITLKLFWLNYALYKFLDYNGKYFRKD